jgi:hypothetical protein
VRVDSFACLDLSDAGFDPIIQAYWIDRPAGRPTPPPPTPWAAVNTARELVEWATAWNGGPLVSSTHSCLPTLRYASSLRVATAQ